MAKKKAPKTKPPTEAFSECFDTINTSGVAPRQWPIEGPIKKWNELTKAEQRAALAYRHPASIYSAFSKVVNIAAIIDPLFCALEDVYSEFPKAEQQYAEANSIPNNYEGIQTVTGEKQYLNSVVSGLLSLMNEAVEIGNTQDATRFAFEAGILWSMSGQTQERRFSSAMKSAMSRGRELIKAESSEAGESIRAALLVLMRNNPSHSLTECREELAKAGTHGCKRTIVKHSKPDTFPEGLPDNRLKNKIKKS